MKKYLMIIFSVFFVLLEINVLDFSKVYATEKKDVLDGKVYELEEEAEYNLANSSELPDKASRFYLEGNVDEVGNKDGMPSYAVSDGNLKLRIDTEFGNELYEPKKMQDWHIIKDKSKKINGTKLSDKIDSGSILLQTSKDGKSWINVDSEVDFYNKEESLNKRIINGEEIDAFYETTNIQQTNGCYYRIIVAYKVQREIEPSKILFITKKNKEEKERLEVYQFYVYDPSVNHKEIIDTTSAYEFGDVFRVDNQDGFEEPVLIQSDDPHIDWSVGKFYVSGYTDYRMDGDIPVFLKVPGDRAALWFNLEQELDKCNGDTGIQVNSMASGSDIYFGTPTIKDLGRGMLIVRKTDKQNKKERQIYTNYLEASATVGANTRVDLFEEGDYEVALDYQLHYDKPFVFKSKTTKTLTYRIFFKFKVRNGDLSVFLRDNDTNQFITNANVAEHGFYIDVANSKYLNMSIKREVLSESMDGLIEDTKFSAIAIDGRKYTDEGIYTVTVENPATGDVVEKKVYVGDQEVMRAHMSTGKSISEINELLATGAYIDENGEIISPEVIEEAQETTESVEKSEENIPVKVVEKVEKETEITTEVEENSQEGNENEKSKENLGVNKYVIMAIIIVIFITLLFVITKIKSKDRKNMGDESL